jgi:hypothetical protein
MKTILLSVALLLALAQAWAADSIRFSETLRDVRVCTRFEGELECEVVQRNSGRFSARITLPNFDPDLVNDATLLGVRVGNFEFSEFLGNATTLGRNRASFRLTEEDGETGQLRRIGTITFSASGHVLRVNGSFSRLPDSFVADSGSWDEDGRGTTDFVAVAGAEEFGKTVHFKARVTERAPRNEGDEPLITIKAAGRADFTRPTVKILSPRRNSTVSTESITLSGTAKDNVEVVEVQYRVNDGDWFTADGTTIWTADVPLELGANLVEIRSLDAEEQASKIATRTITRTEPAP